MRKFLIAVGAVIVVVVGVVVYFVVNLDAVVAGRIERTGSRIAGVPVTVGDVDIALTKGTATIRDLVIANPPGFSDQPAMRFGELSAAVEVSTRVITRLSTTAPIIRVEGSPGRTNIDVLRGNAATDPRDGSDGGSSREDGSESPGTGAGDTSMRDDEPEASAEDETASAAVFEIRQFDINAATAVVDLEGMESPVELAIEQLIFTDLSGTRSDIARQVIAQLTARIMDAVRERLSEVAKEALKAEIERRGEELERKAREKLKSLFD